MSNDKALYGTVDPKNEINMQYSEIHTLKTFSHILNFLFLNSFDI